MPSLYLGSIGGKSGIYEIHVLTKDLPFREYLSSQIADHQLFQDIIRERFNVLKNGKPIFCTAVNPIIEKGVEISPHDDREGTIHFVCLNQERKIVCCLSVAVDTQEKEHGEPIGLPLENRWKANGYPKGAFLDKTRENYLRLHYNRNRPVNPYEMGELYRHFRTIGNGGAEISARIGVYTGCYLFLVREAIAKQLTPTWIWVFDAIPAYFNLYRWAGAAVLRDLVVDDPPRRISPLCDTGAEIGMGQKPVFLKGNRISRTVLTPIPSEQGGSLSFPKKEIHFLDGLIDIQVMEKLVKTTKGFPLKTGIQGFGISDRMRLRALLTLTAKKLFDYHYQESLLLNKINQMILKRLCSSTWDFSHTGECQHIGISESVF